VSGGVCGALGVWLGWTPSEGNASIWGMNPTTPNTAWVYRQSESRLWTVGHTDAAGTWHPESDHDGPEVAAARVRWLNGGGPVGICGVRMTDEDPRFGTRLYVCTQPPGHVQNGDPDHYDGVADAPAGRWRDSVTVVGFTVLG
jgi:hypothetical protein